MALTTASIRDMTVEQDGLDDIAISYRGRTFLARLSEADGAGEYDAAWRYEVAETTDGRAPWDGSDADYDSATAALQAVQVAIRQTVDDDADDRR